MKKVSQIQRSILSMFNQVHNDRVRYRLIAFLTAIVDIAGDTRGGVVAESLLYALDSYSNPRCSEKQALAIAYTAYEHFIYL